MTEAPAPMGRATQLSRVTSAVFKSRLMQRTPLLMMHAVTEACNARCPYCVFRHGKRRQDELSFEEISLLYHEASQLGVQYLHLWGGEPLAHPQIGRIVVEARRNRLTTGMVSNGMLLERKCDAVVPWLDRLYISIDHPSDHHDQMRATPGLFTAALRGLEKARALRPQLPVMVAFTLCRDNVDAVEEMARFCLEHRVRLYVNPMRAESNSGDQREDREAAQIAEVDNTGRVLSWEEQQPVWLRLIELKREGYPVQNSYNYMRQIVRTGAAPRYRCHWPKMAIGVDSNGGIVDCQRWDQPIANLRETSLAEIVRLPRYKQLCGRDGERCNTCSSPARVEPSRFWGLKPAMVSGGVRSFVFERAVRRSWDRKIARSG